MQGKWELKNSKGFHLKKIFWPNTGNNQQNIHKSNEVTSVLSEENMLSLRSLWGYFNWAWCFSFPLETVWCTSNGLGCSGQLIEERLRDFPATNCASKDKWGLGTGRDYREN